MLTPGKENCPLEGKVPLGGYISGTRPRPPSDHRSLRRAVHPAESGQPPGSFLGLTLLPLHQHVAAWPGLTQPS